MKKLLYSLFAVSTLAACTEFDEEVSKEYTDAAATVTVDVKVIADDAVEYTVTPGATAKTFSYAIVEGVLSKDEATEDVVLDNAIATSHEAVKATLGGLDSNAEYTIVAVAYSEHNHAGEVVYKTVKTSDNVAPEVLDHKISGAVCQIEFSETVVIADASKFYALVYNTVAKQFFKSEIAVEANGNVVKIEALDAQAGSFVFFGFEAGAVVDLVGLEAEAIESGIDAEGGYGYYARWAAEAFEVTVKDVKLTNDYKGYVYGGETVVTYTFNQPVYAKSLKAAVTLESARVSATYQVDLTLIDATSASLVIPAEAEAGQAVTIEIAAGAFQNGSACLSKAIDGGEYTVGASYSVADVEGVYTATFASAKSSFSEEWTITSTGNVDDGYLEFEVSGIFADYLSNPQPNYIYVHPKTGEVLFAQGPIGEYGKYGEVYFLDYTSEGEEFYKGALGGAGLISSSNEFVLYIMDAGSLLVSNGGLSLERK